MSRTYAGFVIVAALFAVLLPVHQNWRDEPIDSFPLSYYPMFSHEHAETQEFTYVVGVDLDGGMHHIDYRYAGTGGLNQVRKQIRKIAKRGRRSSLELCHQISERVRRNQPDFHARLKSVSLVTGAFRPYDYFANDVKEPSPVRVHASYIIPGREPSPEDYAAWLEKQALKLRWPQHAAEPGEESPTREILERSLELGRGFLLRNQRPEGNFNYQYDFIAKRFDENDSSVRQAGALWSLSILHARLAATEGDDPAKRAARLETLEGVYRGLAFFLKHTQPGPTEGTLIIAYPGEPECKTGTVALVALTLIDLLRVEELPTAEAPANRIERQALQAALDGYLVHIVGMRLRNGHFSRGLALADQSPSPRFSAYYDGEALLALVKAARYLGKSRLVPIIEASALPIAKHYTLDQWVRELDSDQTKGFFQWSCMAFQEYADAGWKHAEAFENYTLVLGWWMIHVHHTLARAKNTGYAYEGIIQAYRTAKRRGDADAMHDLRWTIDRGLFKLTSWQVGGPLMAHNPFLSAHVTDDPLAVGGVLNTRNEAPLRIDVTQHQMHAVLLALEHVYVDEEAQ